MEEYLYDTDWVNNIITYAASELNDPSYDDAWKSVIYCAYANANPQQAAVLSSDLTSWGTGNTYTNQAYFVATRPNNGGPICSATNSNPFGNYTIKSASNNNYIVASSGSPNLVASGTSVSAAGVFTSSFAPNGGNLLLRSSNQYVTADNSGNFPLSAARATPSTWEVFIIRPKVGAASGVYSIKAASNGLYVTLAGDGTLINNGANEAASAGFTFTPA